jgi:hypothetical protein
MFVVSVLPKKKEDTSNNIPCEAMSDKLPDNTLQIK